MLDTQLQQYVHLSRYARFLDNKKRRETWPETVTRYIDFFNQKYPDLYPAAELYDAIFNLRVMPSMRALMTAGPALERDNVAGFNCSYLPINHPRSLDEAMYILLCGTGVGFSVERQYVGHMPEVPEQLHPTSTIIGVADSKIGWASAFRELVSLLYAGKIPKWDLSRIRPAGARLKTFGGRASGPGPLEALFRFTISVFGGATGRLLTSIELHDLVCKIADVVVVGGVRRSALISLSDLSDERMQRAKSGQWWETQGQRSLANNSVAYTEKPDVASFMREWEALYLSKSGERGIFNREGARLKALMTGRRNPDQEFGTNPCGEIILPEHGFCNLSEAVVRADDDWTDLKEKVRIAAILGTFQSTLTNFRYLRPIWKKNAEEERLLGVSLTGIMDNALLLSPAASDLQALKEVVLETNARYADKLGINRSAASTTNKPSGTVSQLVSSASGLHARYSPFYIRTVRADKKDPLAAFMVAQGFPVEDDVTKPDHNYVFSFPVKSPPNSVCRNDMTAIQQLEHYLLFAEHWCEHNPSITVYVREHEWLDVQAWVYRNFHKIGGVSFLPYSDHVYQQAPYQEIDEATYLEWQKKMPVVDWLDFGEMEDHTTASQELACVGGACEVNL